MNTFCKIILFFTATSYYVGAIEENRSESVEKEELDPAESKDKLEIIKRIKKVNDDGSYTIGYEADDGSFKIESRDVLGNIKGTYGFVDNEGQVKRVSYSTSNGSEVTHKPESSVVQRIPQKTSISGKEKLTSNIPSTTTRPTTLSTTPSSTTVTSSSSNVIQSIARRRTNSISTASSTTTRPNYKDIVTLNSKPTSKSSAIIYTSAAPRVLLQRPSTTSTSKSEGQVTRPTEVVTEKSTQLPIFRHYSLKRVEDKPVTESPEGNILRRQLPQEKHTEYDIQEHVFSLRQPLGDDHPDVYNAGVTITPRPLFTTTPRPSRIVPIISSTTSTPVAVPRPSLHYQRLEDAETSNGEYTQESTTTTEMPIPTVVQIPPNSRIYDNTQEPLVAVRHPFQKGAILVPLSQLQGRIIPVESMREVQEARRQYDYEKIPPTSTVEIEQQKIKKLVPAAHMRPIPVQVDEQGYIREISQPTIAYPVPVPVPVSVSQSKYVESDIENDIDKIEPPVSTKEFQMLLEQLIKRQKRLERIAALTSRKIQQELHNQPQSTRQRTIYQSNPMPYVLQRVPVIPQRNGPVKFEEQKRYVVAPQSHQGRQHVILRQRPQQYDYEQQGSNQPSRRVARLLPNTRQKVQEENSSDQYLPVEVREMLLLRMLQLAMNPALPLDNDDVEEAINAANSPNPTYRRAPMRNVEILGEESEEEERPRRSLRRGKRIREEDVEYLE